MLEVDGGGLVSSKMHAGRDRLTWFGVGKLRILIHYRVKDWCFGRHGHRCFIRWEWLLEVWGMVVDCDGLEC